MKHFKSKKLILPLMGLALLLSGCGQLNNNAPGFYKYLAVPTTIILNGLAKLGGYGVAVIVLTAIVRLILIPVSLYQTKKTTIHQAQLHPIQEQIDRLRNRRINSPKISDRQKASREIRDIYGRYHISSTGGVGCLPLIFQILIFMSLYSSIKFSDAVFHSQILGISLGSKNHIIPIIVFLIYMVQVYISTKRMGDKKKGLWTMFVSPAMIFLVTFGSPAGISIYFIVCAIFACIQAHLTNVYQSKVSKQIKDHEIQIETATEDEVAEIKKQVDTNPTATNEKGGPDKNGNKKDDTKDTKTDK